MCLVLDISFQLSNKKVLSPKGEFLKRTHRGSFGLIALFYLVYLKSCLITGDVFISGRQAGFGGEYLKKMVNF